MTHRANTECGQSLKPLILGNLPDRPLVSVITSSYNYERYVGQAIESVLAQTYQHVEHIVCDDGSTDKSCDIVTRYAGCDSRVSLIRKLNGGQASAWNASYLKSKGQILCMLDADDIFLPDKIELIIQAFLANLQIGLMVHPMIVVDPNDNVIQRIPSFSIETGWLAHRIIQRGGRWRGMFGSALCVRREVAECIFPIPETTLRRSADGYVAQLAPLLVEVGKVDQPLAHYRVHGSNGYATTQCDLATIKKTMNNTDRIFPVVNSRLAELELTERQLDVGRNLNYNDLAYTAALLEGVPRHRLLKPLYQLIIAEAQDNLDVAPQKAVKTLSRVGVFVLPARFRPWWLTQTRAFSRKRRVAQLVLRALRASGSSRIWPRVGHPWSRG